MRPVVAKLSYLGWVLSMLGCSSSSLRPKDSAFDVADAAARTVDCAGDCSFTAQYTIGLLGFFAGDADEVILSPPQDYQHIAWETPDGSTTKQPVTCSPVIPPCSGGASISACDVAQDLTDPVVQAALATSPSPFFGPNTLGIDGDAFTFTTDNGHGFSVGLDGSCADATTCVPVPSAIARLKADLQMLDSTLIATPECANLGVRFRTVGTK